MNLKTLCLFLAAAILPASAFGQYTTITASHIQSSVSGTPLANGYLCLTPVDANGFPASFTVGGGGGQVAPTQTCFPVTSGTISGVSVADTSLLSPQGIGYQVQVQSTAHTPIYTYPQAIFPQGTTWNLDAWSSILGSNAQIFYATSAPTGACLKASMEYVPGGQIYGCVNGAWSPIGGGSGGGSGSLPTAAGAGYAPVSTGPGTTYAPQLLGSAAYDAASSFDASGTAAAALAAALQKVNNLSDLTSASTARTNLGLGTAAVDAATAFDAAGAAASAQTAAEAASLAKANNLSDLASASAARTNLGLGTAALDAATAFDAAGAAAAAVVGLAPTASPAFTGTPTTPTPSTNITTGQIINAAWVNTYFLPIINPTISGTLSIGGSGSPTITALTPLLIAGGVGGLPTPVNPQDAATKAYVDATAAAGVPSGAAGNGIFNLSSGAVSAPFSGDVTASSTVPGQLKVNSYNGGTAFGTAAQVDALVSAGIANIPVSTCVGQNNCWSSVAESTLSVAQAAYAPTAGAAATATYAQGTGEYDSIISSSSVTTYTLSSADCVGRTLEWTNNVANTVTLPTSGLAVNCKIGFKVPSSSTSTVAFTGGSIDYGASNSVSLVSGKDFYLQWDGYTYQSHGLSSGTVSYATTAGSATTAATATYAQGTGELVETNPGGAATYAISATDCAHTINFTNIGSTVAFTVQMPNWSTSTNIGCRIGFDVPTSAATTTVGFADGSGSSATIDYGAAANASLDTGVAFHLIWDGYTWHSDTANAVWGGQQLTGSKGVLYDKNSTSAGVSGAPSAGQALFGLTSGAPGFASCSGDVTCSSTTPGKMTVATINGQTPQTGAYVTALVATAQNQIPLSSGPGNAVWQPVAVPTCSSTQSLTFNGTLLSCATAGSGLSTSTADQTYYSNGGTGTATDALQVAGASAGSNVCVGCAHDTPGNDTFDIVGTTAVDYPTAFTYTTTSAAFSSTATSIALTNCTGLSSSGYMVDENYNEGEVFYYGTNTPGTSPACTLSSLVRNKYTITGPSSMPSGSYVAKVVAAVAPNDTSAATSLLLSTGYMAHYPTSSNEVLGVGSAIETGGDYYGSVAINTQLNFPNGYINLGGGIIDSPFTFSASSAASSSAFTITTAPYTAGTATTNFPVGYFNSGSTAPTTWSTAGTMLGFNSPNGFTGNFLDFHVNGSNTLASISYSGGYTGSTGTFNSILSTTSNNTGAIQARSGGVQGELISGYTSASLAAGAAAGTSPTIACATSHNCSAVNGTLTLTTGTSTGALPTGALLTLTTGLTHTNQPDCLASIVLTASPYTSTTNYLFTYTTTVWTLNIGTALTASTSYTITYNCLGY